MSISPNAGTGLDYSLAANWPGSTLPTSSDDVVITGTNSGYLPSGTNFTWNSLVMTPAAGTRSLHIQLGAKLVLADETTYSQSKNSCIMAASTNALGFQLDGWLVLKNGFTLGNCRWEGHGGGRLSVDKSAAHQTQLLVQLCSASQSASANCRFEIVSATEANPFTLDVLNSATSGTGSQSGPEFSSGSFQGGGIFRAGVYGTPLERGSVRLSGWGGTSATRSVFNQNSTGTQHNWILSGIYANGCGSLVGKAAVNLVANIEYWYHTIYTENSVTVPNTSTLVFNGTTTKGTGVGKREMHNVHTDRPIEVNSKNVVLTDWSVNGLNGGAADLVPLKMGINATFDQLDKFITRAETTLNGGGSITFPLGTTFDYAYLILKGTGNGHGSAFGGNTASAAAGTVSLAKRSLWQMQTPDTTGNFFSQTANPANNQIIQFRNCGVLACANSKTTQSCGFVAPGGSASTPNLDISVQHSLMIVGSTNETGCCFGESAPTPGTTGVVYTDLQDNLVIGVGTNFKYFVIRLNPASNAGGEQDCILASTILTNGLINCTTGADGVGYHHVVGPALVTTGTLGATDVVRASLGSLIVDTSLRDLASYYVNINGSSTGTVDGDFDAAFAAIQAKAKPGAAYNSAWDRDVLIPWIFAGYGLKDAAFQVATNNDTTYGAGQWIGPVAGTLPGSSITSVSVAPTSATIGAGNTTTLVPTVVGSGGYSSAVDWFTSNSSVATVDASGVVTGVSAGTATITAKSNQDPTKTATATITVTIVVSGVTVTPPSANMSIGGTQQLAATVDGIGGTPSQTVSWGSGNTGVATVNASTGLVTAVAAGSATITATSSADVTKSGTASMTVLSAAPLGRPGRTIPKSDFKVENKTRRKSS